MPFFSDGKSIFGWKIHMSVQKIDKTSIFLMKMQLYSNFKEQIVINKTFGTKANQQVNFKGVKG